MTPSPTAPRARPRREEKPPTSTDLRTGALVVAGSVRPSARSVRAARGQLADLAWTARLAGDWATWREVMRRLREVRGRTKAAGWKPGEGEWGAARQLRRTPPAQLRREAEQRVHADAHRIPADEAERAQRERLLTRWRAGAVCEALWGLAHGTREWEAIPTRPTTATVHQPDAATTASVATPQRLTAFVPALPALGIEAHEVRLYRAEYEALLEAWGYTHLQKVNALRARLEIVPGTRRDRAADELATLCIRAYVPHPAKALTWEAYLQGARLGAVFAYVPDRRDVRLAPRRSGDLRECALEIAALMEVMCVCD